MAVFSVDPFGNYVPELTPTGSSIISVTLKINPLPAPVREFVDSFQLAAVDRDDPRRAVLKKVVVVTDPEKPLSVPWSDLHAGTRYEFNASAVNKFTGATGKSSRLVHGSTLDESAYIWTKKKKKRGAHHGLWTRRSWTVTIYGWKLKLPDFYPWKTTCDPEDHFEVTVWVLVKIPNIQLPSNDNYAGLRMLNAMSSTQNWTQQLRRETWFRISREGK